MITITLRQAEELVAFFGGHDAEVTIARESPGLPAGLYAWLTDDPGEGSAYLGATEVDDDLADNGRPNPAAAPKITLAASRSQRAYIAGPMTGLPEFNFPAFNVLAAELRAQGWHIENPAEHGIVEGATWADYLHYDISRIATCEAIFLLPGWSKSKGAALEVHIAQTLGLAIHLSEGAEPRSTPPQKTKAVHDVLAERQRQTSAEGWTPEHDDSEHGEGTALAIAAGCYLLFGDTYPHPGHAPMNWPWDLGWWKPKAHRRNCVRAAALAIAEIERLDRKSEGDAHGC
ncbi:DUF4406 domain-containing protein [Variovorax sp. 2RAF20]